MRITRFDLLRYGKFTDGIISLPKADRDFHLIVGPNEAGKSTLRNAIQDLLFGIETRSTYNFLHPHNEMCLGALIEQDATQLDFTRTKARSKTLQTATGSPLPDNALTPFLGQIDRGFFAQMFGLNHERLVKGGEEILSASNDIGQILFQAAAGIGSLGDIRDKLETEADKLWAKRKSNDREYYVASAELEQAEAALKQATVRTKDWLEARALVDKVGNELKQSRARYQELEQKRIQLERVRRVAPLLIALADQEYQLAELGEVASLADNASDQLTQAELEISTATQSLKVFENQAVELQAKLGAIHPNTTIIVRAEDIKVLSEQRQQLRNHESDIGKREEEIRVLWQIIEESARELGWPTEDEAGVAKRLPGSLIRSAIDNLVRRYEALNQALTTSEEAIGSREDEIKSIDLEISGLPITDIPVALVDALSAARSLGDVGDYENRMDAQILRLKRDLDAKTLELGEWNPGVDKLRSLFLPTIDETNALIKQHDDITSSIATLGERIAEATSEAKTLQLEISQYQSAHQPVTMADVRQIRTTRDLTWQAIKAGKFALTDAAPGYEKEVAESDALSDKRYDKAQEETELQSRADQLQRLQQQIADLELRRQESTQALTLLDQHWDERIKAIGLVGMRLLQVNSWRTARDRVLSAVDALVEEQSSRDNYLRNVERAKAVLMEEMLPIKPEAKKLNLSALILLADDVINVATRAQERRSTLASQKTRAGAAIKDSKGRVAQAQTALDTWRADLKKNLALAHLQPDEDIGTIEGALILFDRMDKNLQKIREIRTSRIDMMRRDLNDFANAAKSLAKDIAPEIALETSTQVVLKLDSRLAQESAALQERERLESELERAQTQINAASNRISAAQASLEPLLRMCGAGDNDGLRLAIRSSDRSRLLSSDIDQARKQLLQAGDGLNREALRTEFEANDASLISTTLSEIKIQVDEVVLQQNRLSTELSAAEMALGKIAGQDEAARAESQRQEALARMGNAVERFIKVFVAAKLLRWSIERFREEKQGPMLARASEIFSGLTNGAFGRLVVDYESEPLKLSGQRATGEFIDIDGMSEGTRDQLYLALRLAALELHLEQTLPLPFIADDLFINYDDGRAKAGLEALARLSEMTQVVFLTHHDHLVSVAQSVFGDRLNVVRLARQARPAGGR